MVTTATLLKPVTCIPAWFAGYLAISNKMISSGYSVDGAGNVPADPTLLAAAAGRKLVNDTSLPADLRRRGARLSLAAYTLARYVTTEVGTASIGDAVAVLQDAVNQAARRGYADVNRLLLGVQALGHPNRGWYGPINAGKDAPYGRWAATTKDPTVRAIALAQDVLDGVIPRDFNKGGVDQANLTLFDYPAKRIHELANEGLYWTGPLPGANHRRSMHFAPVSDATVPTATTMITRAITALSSASPSWGSTPICDGSLSAEDAGAVAAPFWKVGLVGVLALGLGVGAMALIQRHRHLAVVP